MLQVDKQTQSQHTNDTNKSILPEDTFILKVVMIGDSGVGKSNLLNRFCKNEYSEEKKPTIGVEFIPFDMVLNEKHISIHFWDTAGQEKYRGITSSYYKDAFGVCLVYDITNKNTFLNLEIWLDEIHNFCSFNLVIMLIGNKIDIKESRRVSPEEADEFAKKHGLFFMEASAKSNENDSVNLAFHKILEEIMKNSKTDLMKKEMAKHAQIRKNAVTVEIKNSSPPQKMFCCST